MFILLLLACAAAVTPEPWGPEAGDIISDASLVVTFVKNEPRLVIAPPRHERHYDLVLPSVRFGDTTALLSDGGATGFFSSYERDDTQLTLVLEATHPDANATLACSMPGDTPTDAVPPTLDPLAEFPAMLTCIAHVYSHTAAPHVPAALSVVITSRQRDRVTVANTAHAAGVILAREDAHHILRVRVDDTAGNITTADVNGGVEVTLAWDDVTPATGIVLAFHMHLVATTPREIAKDQRVLFYTLVCGAAFVGIVYATTTAFKQLVLGRDAHHRNIIRAVSNTRRHTIHALQAPSAEMDRLCAAGHVIASQHTS